MNPYTIELLPAQWKALVMSWSIIGHITKDESQRLVIRLAGRQGQATYKALRDLDTDKVFTVADGMNIMLSPQAVDHMVTLGYKLSLVTPVMPYGESFIFPFTSQGDQFHLAAGGDRWCPPDEWEEVIVPAPQPTQFGINPYSNSICGPSYTRHNTDGAVFPVHAEHIRAKAAQTGGIATEWNNCLTDQPPYTLTLVVAVLLHHPSFWYYTDGKPHRAFACLVDPAANGFDPLECKRVVNATADHWKTCYNAYTALLQPKRITASASLTAAPKPKRVEHHHTVSVQVNPRALEEFALLLMSLFSSVELRRYVRFGFDEQGKTMDMALPGRTASPAAVAHAVVTQLKKRGLLTHKTFSMLGDARPYRTKDIERMAAKFGITNLKYHYYE